MSASDEFLTYQDLKKIADELAADAREAQLAMRVPGASRRDHSLALARAESAEHARKVARRAWRRERNNPFRLMIKLAAVWLVLWGAWSLGRLMGGLNGCHP